MNRAPGLPFSPLWLALDLAGVAMLIAGVLGLAGGSVPGAPQLADPTVAWTLVVCGAALTAAAAVFIMRDLHARPRGR